MCQHRCKKYKYINKWIIDLKKWILQESPWEYGHISTLTVNADIKVVLSPFDVSYMKVFSNKKKKQNQYSILKSHLSFINKTNVTNVFPHRRAITRGTLAWDPRRYSALGLWNNGPIFIYLFFPPSSAGHHPSPGLLACHLAAQTMASWHVSSL